jgi:hypothetical protein
MMSLTRACASFAIAGLDKRTTPIKALKANWSHDTDAEYLVRSSVVPENISGSASALMRQIMPDFLSTLTPESAGARLMKEGLNLEFNGAGSIAVPTLLADTAYASFIASGQPIPVTQGYVEPLVTLTPHKLVATVVLTAETIRSSNVEALMQDALVRSSALALDAAMFDASPSSSARPAGLRYNIVASAASTAPDNVNALLDDVQTLHDAVEDVTPRHPIYIMSPTRALMSELRSPHGLDPLTVLGSYALHGTDDVIAVAPPALVSVFDGTPQIESSPVPLLNMDDVPLPIVEGGVLASPTRSAWQTNCIAIKVRLPVTWGLRVEPGLGWLTAKNW